VKSSEFRVSSFKWTGWLALALLAGCSSPKPASSVDPELSRVTVTARQSFDKGSPAQAARLYLRALNMARAADDAFEIGNNAYNLGACLIAMEKYADARALLAEARREFARLQRDPADIILLEARAALGQGELDAATALADQVVPAAKADAGRYRVLVALLKARVACERGDAAGARAELSRIQRELDAGKDPVVQAEAAGVSGLVCTMENDPGKAAPAYDLQAESFRRAARHREMALALGRAGKAYAAAGIPGSAGDRFYRAGRSLFAQGDDLEALRMVEAALNAAEASGNRDELQRAMALFEEIKAAAKKSAPAPDTNAPPAAAAVP
jgi:hypothetical protein